MYKYRVNYGQGQVWGSFESLKEVKQYLKTEQRDQYFNYFFVERYVDGEWFFYKKASELIENE